MAWHEKIEIESTPVERIAEIVATVTVLVGFALPIYFRSSLPGFFNVKSALFILPFAGLLFFLVLGGISRLPHRLNYPWEIRPYNIHRQFQLARAYITSLKAELAWVFVYMEWVEIGKNLGLMEGMGILFLPSIIAIIMVTTAVYLYSAHYSR
jgi:hypothetical protein